MLREYSEAGTAARQHEQLTRTSISVFVPTLLALLGYVMTGPDHRVTQLLLSLVGVAISLLVANVVRRHQLYYASYIKRARVIETELRVEDNQVIYLYTQGKDAALGSHTIRNKTAFVAVFLGASFIFLSLAVWHACRLACGL